MPPSESHNWDPPEEPTPPQENAAAGDKEAPFRPTRGKTVEPAKTKMQKLWRRLCVWMPTLANPHEKRCLIRYESRDARTGMKWTVVLPRQCWMCGQEEDLSPRRFDEHLRVYHQPVMIVSVAAAIAVLIMLTTLCWMSIWLVALVCIGIVVGGAWVLLKMKSWYEDVRLHVWSCHQHAGILEQPDTIIEDEALHIFLPTPEIARAAREDLKERRKSGPRGKDAPADSESSGASAAPPSTPSSPMPDRARSPYRPVVQQEELPPIKLHGDEDDDPAGDDLLVDEPSQAAQEESPSSSSAAQQESQREEPPRKPDQQDDEAWFDQ